MKQVVFAILILICTQVRADGGFVSVKAGAWMFETDGITSKPESESGLGVYSAQAGYSFFPKTQAVLGFNVLLSDGLSGDSGFGFDLGGHYFPFTDAGSSVSGSDGTTLKVTEIWRPYVGLFFRQRTFNFILSTTFVGPGLSVGVDYALNSSWFLNLELRYDLLYGPDDGEATQTNLLFGAGIEF